MHNNKTPGLLLKLFRIICRSDAREYIEGDLNELFEKRSKKFGYLIGTVFQFFTIISFLRPPYLNNKAEKHNKSSNLGSMLINYLKISLRNLRRRPLSSFINLFGLVIGLTSSLLIFKYAFFELSYDKFHQEAEQLYRVTTVNFNNDVMVYKDAMSFNQTGPVLKDELPEITEFTRAFDFRGISMRSGNNLYIENEVLVVDPAFLSLFNHPVISGEAEGLLTNSYSIVLTSSHARKYFGDTNPTGEFLQITEGQMAGNYIVTGVVEDVPDNTHLKFDLLISYSTFWQAGVEPNWSSFNDYTYIKTQSTIDFELLQSKVRGLSRKYLGENSTLEFYLQPVTSIHLYSDFAYEPEPNGSAKVVYFLILLALLIVTIAWVNYINLTTAKSLERAKEVGIRKTIGASRKMLIVQFFTEAIVMSAMAVFIAGFAVYLSLPGFRVLTGINLPPFWDDPLFWKVLTILFVFGSLFSGLYPAIVQSGYQTVSILKGKFLGSRRGILLRKVLVVFQFTATLFFIAGTLIVYRQINHMLKQDLGMNLERVLVLKSPSFEFPGFLQTDSLSRRNFQLFRNEVSTIPEVLSVTTSSSIPSGGPSNIGSMSGGLWWENNINENRLTYYLSEIDEAFLEVYEIDLLAGEPFYQELPLDTIYPAYINMSALKSLGFPNLESAIGEKLLLGSDKVPRFRVKGVINDFNRQDLRHSVEPTIYLYNRHGNGFYYSLKFSGDNYNEVIKKVEDKWKLLFPATPFDYSFADELYSNQYKSDRRFARVFVMMAILAIAIACLGLYGLANVILQYRTKEIGIRKALGASLTSILMLLNKSFIALVGVSILLGLPLIYYTMNLWLQSYATRISIELWVFLVSSLAVILIVLVTISSHVIRAAFTNPTKALRYE